MKSTVVTKNQKTNNDKKHKYNNDNNDNNNDNNDNNNNNKRIEEATEGDPLLLSSSSTIVVTSSRDSTNTTTLLLLLFEKIQSLFFIKMSGKSSSSTGGDDNNIIHTTTIDENNISNSIDHEPNHDDSPSLLSYGSSGIDGGNTTLNTNDSSIDQNFIRSIRSIRSARSDELSRDGGSSSISRDGNSGGRRANSNGSSYQNQRSQQQHYQHQQRNNNNHHHYHYHHHHHHHHSRQHQHDGRAEKLHEYYNQRAKSIFSERRQRTEPLIEVSSEVMDVRRRALKVYEPLTYTWLFFVVGFSISASLAMARWTGLLAQLSYWFVLLPCWSSHVGLFICHVYSIKMLFSFINEANNQRQTATSTDHIDRVEYLPLLQRALRFGLKTGSISILLFIFEILLYLKLANQSLSLTVVLTPLWMIVGFGIVDGIICKTQHFTRVFSWVLILLLMLTIVLKVDYGYDDDLLRLQIIILGLLVAILALGIGTLIYILCGHHIGYFRLTNSQLNAGRLYVISLIIASVLLGMIISMHMARPNIFQVRVIMAALAPLSVALVGLGAYAITLDEFEQLLQFGGQSSIQPMRLRLEKSGWTAVEGKGATNIPMFGEVRYEPLNSSTKTNLVELCMCCTCCYPYEDDEEATLMYNAEYPGFADNMSSLRIQSSTIG